MNVEALYSELLNTVENNDLHLATPPEIVISISRALEDDSKSLQDIVQIISRNPVVVARLLQVANSPAIHQGHNSITTILDAINQLGLQLVKSLVFCITMKDKLVSKDPVLNGALRKLWSHSIVISSYCAAIAPRLGLRSDTALMAGLLHDIGEMPVMYYYETHRGCELPPLEDSINVVAPLLGAAIMKRWNFDSSISDASHYRTAPTFQGRPRYVDLVSLVHTVVYAGLDSATEMLARLNLERPELEDLMREADAMSQTLT